jgi:hypothetical protein
MSEPDAPDEGDVLKTLAVHGSLATIDHPDPSIAVAIAANTAIFLFGRIEDIVAASPTRDIFVDTQPALSLIARRMGQLFDRIARLRAEAGA